MNNEHNIAVICLFGSVLISIHLLFRIYIFLRKKNLLNFVDCLLIFCILYHFFFEFLFYSGRFLNMPFLWISHIVMVYFASWTYVAYIEVTASGNLVFKRSHLLLFPVLLIHLGLIVFLRLSDPDRFHEVFENYVQHSVTLGFPDMNFLYLISLQWILVLGVSSRFLFRLGYRYQEYAGPVRIPGNPDNTFARYMLKVNIFTIFWRLGVTAWGLISGRDSAFYFISLDLLTIVFNVIQHEIHPLLVKAGVLRFMQKNALPLSAGDLGTSKLKLGECLEKKQIYLDQELTLKMLAREMQLGEKTLSQYLNQVLNTNFKQLISDYRVKHACQILRNNPDINVIHAGFDSGFNSTSTFYRQFKNKTGMSPEEYQKSVKTEPQRDFENASGENDLQPGN